MTHPHRPTGPTAPLGFVHSLALSRTAFRSPFSPNVCFKNGSVLQTRSTSVRMSSSSEPPSKRTPDASSAADPDGPAQTSLDTGVPAFSTDPTYDPASGYPPTTIPSRTFGPAVVAPGDLASRIPPTPSTYLENDYLRLFARAVPQMGRQAAYKGEAGRIAVIGGSEEYTGAPYFAAMSTLVAGGELAHVYCAREAAAPIKSYSPELIVHPGFDDIVSTDESAFRASNTSYVLDRMHSVILGPGLGRSEEAHTVVTQVIRAATTSHLRVDANAKNWPLVLDADALYFLAIDESLRAMLREHVSSSSSASDSTSPVARIFLTPNKVELARLCKAVDIPEDDPAALAAWFVSGDTQLSNSRVVVIAKGESDRVAGVESASSEYASFQSIADSDGSTYYRAYTDLSAKNDASAPDVRGSIMAEVKSPGALKRCGGQGDVLAGLLGLFAGWSARFVEERIQANLSDSQEDAPEDEDAFLSADGDAMAIAAAVVACVATRRAAHAAFLERGRGMITGDIVRHVVHSLEHVTARYLRDA